MTEIAVAQWSTTARVLLTHADTGSTHAAESLDDFRPLSSTGWAQAEGAAAALRGLDLRCLLSSPSLRCRQTLMPLARALAIDIEPLPDLARTAPGEVLLDLVASNAAHGAVLCTHPQLIAKVLRRLKQTCGLQRAASATGMAVWLIHDARSDTAAGIRPLSVPHQHQQSTLDVLAG